MSVKKDQYNLVRLSELEEEQSFAKQSAEDFSGNEKWHVLGTIAPGEKIALRWGLDNDCVLILQLSEAHTPTIYQNIIKEKQ